MSKKKKLVGGLSLAVIGLGCLTFISKPTYKTIDNNNLYERMAVYIKNDTGNYEKSNNIPTSGYILNEEKSTCNNNAKPTWNKSNKSLKISNLNNDNTSCYLYFDELEGITSSDIIAEAKTETPDFSQIADTDEGVFSVADPMYGGTSYYYRGAVTNNYVQFAGFCWRIIRINGDGSIRMIYDGISCHANGTSTAESIAVASQAYNSSSNKSYYVGYTYAEDLQRPTDNAIATASNLKTQTDSWYNEHLASYDSQIAEGKFCNDREVANGNTWSDSNLNYAASERLAVDMPTLSCHKNDVYELKIGAITADEVIFAGSTRFTGPESIKNNLYYLYNGNSYWTMTPIYNSSIGVSYLYNVADGAILGTQTLNSNYNGIRPLINLRADTIFQLGTDGTIDNPYVVEGA